MIYLRTLLGKNNLDFSLSCLKSCINNCVQETILEVFEDGSLTDEAIIKIQTEIPQTVIKKKVDRDAVMHKMLKPYPLCNAFRNANIFGFKLFDTILYEPKPFFYLDSDIIFFKKFTFPLTGGHPIFMMDAENAYSFSDKEVLNKRNKLLPRINAGFYFFPVASFNLDIIEDLLNEHINDHIYGNSWSEQSIWSFLAFKNKPVYYFNPKAILMASPIITVTKQIIAIHFSKPYRSKIQAVIKKIKALKQDCNAATIHLVPSKDHIFFLPYLLRKYSNKVLRKLKRI